MTNLFTQSDIEAAAKAIWMLEMKADDSEWAAYPEDWKKSRIEKVTVALTAATASLEKRGAMKKGTATSYAGFNGEEWDAETNKTIIDKLKYFPVAIIRLETAE